MDMEFMNTGGMWGVLKADEAWYRWVNDPGKVMAWMKKYNLRKMLDVSGGIVKIPNFLPTAVQPTPPDSSETARSQKLRADRSEALLSLTWPGAA